MKNRATNLFIMLSIFGMSILSVTASAREKSNPSGSPSACVFSTDEAVADLFRKWNLALASLDSAKVAALYWPNAVLLPTVSNIPRTDTASITEYFDHFLKKSPRGTIVKRITYHGCNMSMDAGTYDFSVMDPAGNASVVSARYTFIYTYLDGTWKIQHHHSSAMPEPVQAAHEADSDHSTPAEASVAEKKTPPITDAAGARVRIQLESASRTPSSFLSAEQRRKVGREAVGIKVCADSQEGERRFEVSDPAPYIEANESALAWGRASRWTVTGAPSKRRPACAQVVVRFSDAGL